MALIQSNLIVLQHHDPLLYLHQIHQLFPSNTIDFYDSKVMNYKDESSNNLWYYF